MENENSNIKAHNEDDGQMTFGNVSRDVLADTLVKTNVDELTDSECRELLKELTKLAEEK